MPELQDFFRSFGEECHQNHNLSYAQAKAMSAIEQCGTATLGYHIDTCENCGNAENSYNSCCNSYCPKCQTLSKERWLDNQKRNLIECRILSCSIHRA